MTPLFWILWLSGLLISTFVGAYVVRFHREKGLYFLGVMLAIYVVGANVLVPRLAGLNIFGLSFVLVTGSIIWPYTAQLSDMINEIYGKKSAIYAAALSYTANLMFVLFVLMAFQTPAINADAEPFFKTFFGVAWRVLLASTCSYTLANLADISVFAGIKKTYYKQEATAGNILKYSGLRSILSDGVNMVIDNVVFYTIAFLGTMPFPVLLGLIGSSMAAKVIMSQIDLPFYWAFRMMTRGVQRDL